MIGLDEMASFGGKASNLIQIDDIKLISKRKHLGKHHPSNVESTTKNRVKFQDQYENKMNIERLERVSNQKQDYNFESIT